MGKATIVGGGTDGLYQVALDYGKATQTARLNAIDARLAELVGLLSAALQALNLQEYAQAALVADVEGAIAAFVAAAQALAVARQTAASNNQAEANAALKAAEDAYQATLKAHTEALKKLAESTRKTAPLKLALDLLKAEQTQLKKDQDKWAALVLEKTLPAWCADLTEDASGDVATIEIPGEDKLVLIAPSAPAHVPAADGVLAAREVQTSEQVFFNAAILPGWQKYKPTFRRGTITAIDVDANTADVKLEAGDTSSAQGLGINQTSTLSAVPVTYMTCNASAFDVGDRCVVKFTDQDWAQPTVIGFVDNPKPCLPQFVYVPYAVMAEQPVAVGTRPWIFNTYFTAGYEVVGQYSPSAAVMTRRIKIVPGVATASVSPVSGYAIQVNNAVDAYIPDSNHMPSINAVPPGENGVSYGVNSFSEGKIWIRKETMPVGMKTLPLYPSPAAELFTGGYYSGAPSYTDETPVNMPFDDYMKSIEAIPSVTMTHNGIVYKYTLDSAVSAPVGSGNALKFRFSSRAV